MEKLKNRILIFLFMVTPLVVNAQADAPEMAELFRSSGKIYVVIAIVLAILIGLTIYLISTDNKLKKLQKEVDNLK